MNIDRSSSGTSSLSRVLSAICLFTSSVGAVEGWFYHGPSPYVWSVEKSAWHVTQAGGSGLFLYDASAGSYTNLSAVDGKWCFASILTYPWVYALGDNKWYYFHTESQHLDMYNLSNASWDYYGESATVGTRSYAIVDTGQSQCYNNAGSVIPPPAEGEALYGQDAQHQGNAPQYRDNGDGTVTDLVTGLMWQQGYGESKLSYQEALAQADSFSLAGHEDWRLPSIKELWSIFQYIGKTGFNEGTSIPFIDTGVFPFAYGDTSTGERFIDAQYVSSTEYVGTTMNNNATVFGVNFADGRIKGYPKFNKLYYVKYVRGNPQYGINNFQDMGDGTITDHATGLMWMKIDSGHLAAGPNFNGPMTWEEALSWAENLVYAGYDDWRLPDGKELHSIVDYTRAPEATDPVRRGPAIDPIFQISSDQSYFWTSSSHVEVQGGDKAAYVCFGQSLGYMPDPWDNYNLIDVHGAGAIRSDPKVGDPADFPYGKGPQGDEIRIYNYVRAVRGVD